MPSTFGNRLSITVFGQSHSAGVGCVVEGFPSGFAVDIDALEAFVERRAPGHAPWDTPRKEKDAFRILSGLNPDGITCGAPFSAIIENTNTRPGDYSNLLTVPRPGHADFTAWAKWHGAQDASGGGHFSARVTGPLCVAGGIALQMLAAQGVRISAHLLETAGVSDEAFCLLDNSPEAQARLSSQMDAVSNSHGLPVIDQGREAAITAAVMAARAEKDTVGGVVECVATGIPAGVGSPMFDGMESNVARAIFGIPAVKGVEFGLGFEASRVRGSQDNDPYEVRDGRCVPRTNNAGGILGGITTGSPLFFRVGFKPISSISLEQDSVDLLTMTPTKLSVRGRHDTCPATRAVPIVEAVCALVVLDSILTWPADPETTTRHEPQTA